MQFDGEDRRRLVQLDQDHPGFRDPVYRARRDAIARLAIDHRTGQRVPDAPYTDDEHRVWAVVFAQLTALRPRVCVALRDAAEQLALPPDRIPQLSEVNHRIAAAHGMTIEPVAGLVQPGVFLTNLGQRVFLGTQYIRHHSQPLYTPEPDVIHEIIGHAASLTHEAIVEVSVAFGQAAARCADEDTQGIQRLIRAYWYTLEFGAVWEQGEARALGAGLLSSVGELARFSTRATLRPFDLGTIGSTDFDPTTYQPHVFVAPGLDAMCDGLLEWLTQDRWSG